MNIEEFINYEAGSGSENDVAYAKELRRAYSYYKDFPRGDVLIDALRDAREDNRLTNSSHRTTADCMIIHKLLMGDLK